MQYLPDETPKEEVKQKHGEILNSILGIWIINSNSSKVLSCKEHFNNKFVNILSNKIQKKLPNGIGDTLTHTTGKNITIGTPYMWLAPLKNNDPNIKIRFM
ncbi:unnamed protein product [Gordionus sp. m RMFG-2023]